MPVHLIDHGDGTLDILDPVGWRTLPTREPYQWKPFGYRLYREVVVHGVWRLWLDDMLPLFQMVNTGLQYPGICRVVIPPPREIQRKGETWRTYPCPRKIGEQMKWAGLRVEQVDGELIGKK